MRPSIQSRFSWSLVFFFFVLALLFMAELVNAQTYYSRKTGNWDDNSGTGTWSTAGSHAGAACSCTPAAGSTVFIGSGHTVTFRSGLPAALSIAVLKVDDDGGGGTLTFGNGATVTTLTITGDVTIGNSGTLQAGATGATAHTINFGGNLTNNNVLNFTANAATNQIAVFNGGAINTVGGTGGTYTFENFTLNSASNLNVNSSIQITNNGVSVSTFTFQNGIVILNATSNITMGSLAAWSGAGSTGYIQGDGASTSGSQVVRITRNNNTDWKFLFPVGTSTGGYSPVDLTAATVAGTNPALNATLSVKAIYNSSVIGQLRRTFRLITALNGNATTLASGKFTYANPSTPDVSQGDVIGNYSTIWFLSLSTATWANLAGTAPGATFFTPTAASSLQSGTYYFTIGNSTAYPSTWYSYQTGNWSNPDVWTLDPSGTTLNNPLTQSPNSGDQVVILNGFTVTVDVNNLSVSTTTINGGATLDMAASTGQNLGTVSGTGLLRVKGVNLPTGVYNNFVAAVTGGTVEFYDATGTLPTPGTNPVLPNPTFNNLLLTNSSGSITFTTATNLVINNNLNVGTTSGLGTVTWQINNGTATALTLTIAGDLTIASNGKITAGTGTGATPHSLTITGNMTNNGIVQFFNPGNANLSVANYNTGATATTTTIYKDAVNVTFTGTNNKTITCNNQTDFYRLIVSKGTGEEAILTVNSAATGDFRVFGSNAQAASGTAPNLTCQNSISIQNGTLELTGNINIPSMAEQLTGNTDGYVIPQNGALWLNGNVTILVSAYAGSTTADNGRRILLSGLLKVTSGSFTTGVGTGTLGWSKGISAEDDGIMIVQGGTVSTSQLRTRVTGTNNFAYQQTGGVVNVGSFDGIDSGFARFDLQFTTCTFIMTNGILNISNPTNNVPSGFRVGSASSSYSVTGGTINANLSDDTFAGTFNISSTAPLFNLNINRTGSTQASSVTLSSALTVLNNLTLVTGANLPTFNCAGFTLTIGGTFDMQTGTTLTPNGGAITFNGSAAQTWKQNGTITNFTNTLLTINKSAGTLSIDPTSTGTFPNFTGTGGIAITAGTFDDGGKTLTTTGSLSNSGKHTSTSGTGSIVFDPNVSVTLGGSGGIFGNLTLQTSSGTPISVSTAGNQTVTGILRLETFTSLNIASYNFAALGSIFSNATNGVAFSANNRIQTNGLRNDGGLTLQATAQPLLFPVGTATTTTYTPITITTTATTYGTITVQPATGAHPAIAPAGVGLSLNYFWRVSSSGFAGITAVSHSTYTYTGATAPPPTGAYTIGRYDQTNSTWAYRTATYPESGFIVPTFDTGGVGANAWTGISTSKIDGEYTIGPIACFGTTTIYYSRQTGNWSVPATWSNVGVGNATAAASAPCATCPVIIGDGSHSHTITNDANNQGCGTLYLDANSVLDCGTSTGLSFGVNTTGTGKLRIGRGTFPGGDFVNFLGTSGGTVEWYGATGYSIPTTGTAPLSLANYYNLIISPSGGAGQQITLPTINVTVYNNLTINASATSLVYTDPTGARTMTVNGALNVSSGTLSFRNGAASTWVVGGNTTISTGATVAVQSTTTQTHSFTTAGGITNNGTMTFKSATGAEVINLVFTGTSPAALTGASLTASTTLNQLTVNKGTSQTPVLTFGPLAGTLSTPSGDPVGTLPASNSWLTLTNGTINFDVTGATFIITNAATRPYTIPSTANLSVQAGTVDISGAFNDSDLLLAGTLQVAGGIVNVGPAAGANSNDIEYSAAGTPTIIVSAGTLYVNSSIRRPTTTLSGSLVYNQSGGTVTAGGRNSDTSRGIFEIDSNTGSSFTMSGGTLTVSRSTGGSTYSDLYINPVTSSVLAASTIQIGSNTLGAQTLTINIVPAVGIFTVLGAAGNAQTVNMVSSTLTSSGTLTINTASTLKTNGLNVFIGGDLTINGTYDGSANTTTFNGNGTQNAALTAGGLFQNISINKPSGTAILTGSATITNLSILSGTLNVNGAASILNVGGYIINNSTQIGTGFISVNGSGTAQAITSNNGSFTNLTVAGSGGSNVVSVTGNMAINGTLTFTGANRYLFIGSYLLSFGSSATISGAGASDFIRTNGVSSDLGVLRNWPTGTSSFTYAVGTLTNYTPLTISNLVVSGTGAGTLTLVPVNQRHPTYNVSSTDQILNYYWIMTRGSTLALSANTGTQSYTFPSTLMGGGITGTLKAAYLDLSAATLGWNTTDPSGAATTSSMTFTNSFNTNMPLAGNTFHYSVGTSSSLPNPINPVYSRTNDPNSGNLLIGGSWNSPSSWTATVGGNGPALGSAPTGVPVVIVAGTRINMNVNARNAFTTQLNGLVVVGTSYGHNFGIISGTGTLQTATNTFPAGTYTSFVSSSGGTIEYVATSTPMSLNGRSTYNNLKASGTGTLNLAATDLTLNGGFNISTAGVTITNTNNNNISLAGNWSNSGTFSPGLGTVTFNGASAHTITGSTAFFDLSASSSGNITLSGSGTTTVTDNLNLTQGNIISSSTHQLTLSSTATTITGGGASSFIQGPFNVPVSSGGTFLFPLGNVITGYRPMMVANTNSADTWTVQYVGNDPTTDGYNHKSFNAANIAKISGYEYWLIGPTSTSNTADVTLTYGVGSYNNPPNNIGTVANLRVVHWNGSQWDLPSGGGSFSESGDTMNGTVTVTGVNSFSPFTFGSLDSSSPLPITLISFTGVRNGSEVDLDWKTASEIDNDHFDIERSTDGIQFSKIGALQGFGTTTIQHAYHYVDKEVLSTARYYYRLRQVNFDQSGQYSGLVEILAQGESAQRWIVFPNPYPEGQPFQVKLMDATVSSSAITQMTLTSFDGRTILKGEGNLEELNPIMQRTLSNQSSGIYLLQVWDGEVRNTFRIIRY
jgi:fibronectin-binding autotransporter adhesin